MVAPLLALGLMGLAGWGNQAAYDRRKQEGAGRVAELLGMPPEAMGPPDESGAMGSTSGRGLLASPTDPMAQMRFAQGLLTLPKGQADLAARMFGDQFQRMQQAGQFQQREGREGAQFAQEQQRLSAQFQQQYGLSKQQADEMARQHEIGNVQWGRQFAANRDEAAQRIALERERLGIARDAADAKGSGLPKLKEGYTWTRDATGATVAMPIPGTKDYADATGAEQALVSASGNVGRFIDIFAGKKTGPSGTRVGGTGTELWGETAGTLSSIRAKVIADIAVLRNMGVLQQGEAERLEEQLPDPTNWKGPARSNKGATAAYEEVQRQLQEKLGNHRTANPWLLPPPPPGAVVDGPAPASGRGANARAAPQPAPASGPPSTAKAYGITGAW